MKSIYLKANDVAALLDIGKPHAYKIMQMLNEELKAKGYITIAGRVPRRYLLERVYGGEEVER